MAGNFQDQFSCKLSFDNSFSDFTSDDDDTVETKKENEDANNKEIVIEERVASGVPEQDFITLEELANSDFIRERQVAAKSIVEYLHQAGSNREALHSVISVMCRLSEDEDIMVRSELFEQIPSIALFCKEHSEELGVVIRQQIVPYTVKLLTDIQIQIRKTGHSILLILLENNVIDHSQLSEWICPLVAQLVISENIPEGLRLEDVSVMCKMIPYVGKEITEKFFLEPFLSLCRDSTSSAREVCMVNFGTISQVIGRETTEKALLCAFLDLCQESQQVKAKCVDIAIDLATTVSSITRKEILSPVYMSFLKEECDLVSREAYLSLGRFISTFAEPSKTGLKYNDGMWIDAPAENDMEVTFQSLQSDEGHCFEFLTSGIVSKAKFLEECSFKNLQKAFNYDRDELPYKTSSTFSNCKLQFESNEPYESSRYSSSETFCDTVFISNLRNLVEINNDQTKLSDIPNSTDMKTQSETIASLNMPSNEKHVCLHIDNENIFNNFQFWRVPLPEVDLETEENKTTSIKTDLEKETSHSYSSELSSSTFPNLNSNEPDMLRNTDDSKLKKEDKGCTELNLKSRYVCYINNQLEQQEPIRNNFWARDLYKKEILEKQRHNVLFFKEMSSNQESLNEKRMTDTEKMVYDQDIVPPELLMEFINEVTVSRIDVKNLAYFFPSVAYTLGRKHWPCIRDLFIKLSSLLQFNIRKIVASSLHELAVILGPEITTEDLLPVFLRLLKCYQSSLLIKNMSSFLKKTKPQARRQFLPFIEKICSWDEDDHNWRDRLTVSEQLILCVELFSSHEALYFLPASLLIMQDKVSAVRRSGVELLAVIVRSIAANARSSKFLKMMLCALDEKYRKSNKWLWRQFYVFICQDLAAKRSLPTELYVEIIVPSLFALAWDAVPNVRLAVARCLALTLSPLDYITSVQKMNFELLLQVLYSLQNDVDKDVRHFAHLYIAASGIFKSNDLSPEEESDESQCKESEQ